MLCWRLSSGCLADHDDFVSALFAAILAIQVCFQAVLAANQATIVV